MGGGAPQPHGLDGWAYRPHLDGLRALAVYMVLVFHVGVGAMSGGFIGVDVFFVLSGYLVTGVLLRDLQGPSGRVRFGRFYARRARRLLPASLAVLVVVSVAFSILGGAAENISVLESVRAAALYVANWHFIAQSTDYFAADLDASPVLHFWSLAVEEQFYLAWPLILAAIFAVTTRFGRRQMRAAVLLVGALASLSLVGALKLAGSETTRAYYGTDTRAYQLLAGALVAMLPGLVLRARSLGSHTGKGVPWPGISISAVGGLVILGTSILGMSPIHRGVLTTAVTVGLLIALEASEGGWGIRILSFRPLAYLGRISYGIYLWHWVVIVLLRHEFDLSTTWLLVVTSVSATALAGVSYHLIEMPVRTATILDARRWPTVGAGLVMSLLVGVVAAPALLSSDAEVLPAGSSVAALGPTDTVNDRMLGQAFLSVFDYRKCPSSAPDPCVLASGDAGSAIVVGDSHAGVYAPMLADLAREQDLTLYGGMLSYCPWTQGIRFNEWGPDCLDDQDQMFEEILPRLDPDIVFLAHLPADDPNQPSKMRDRDAGVVGGASLNRHLERRVRSLVERLVADGRKVVLFEPLPVARTEDDPFACLDRGGRLKDCRFTASHPPTAEDRVFRQLDAESSSVVSLDMDRASCPSLPTCEPVLDGQIVRRDYNHLTVSFARTLREAVEDRLVSEGFLG
ncbi:MAG: acyltransferase [Microthrixaceae bacterium]|nr:acyltransferase [Acidimicrobiales bacterium]MCB9403577.1 acyltransferase [Microthrixaceae bacterium]